MKKRKHRGKKPIDRPMSIEKIESRFDELLMEKQELAEAFMLGRNKYGNADEVPMMKAAR
jgi:hypothetical protein